jgi:F-type H+-transporting ATPase subunit b
MNINATLFVQALSFAALIWFSVRFVWPMITNAMDERTKRIADGLAAAEAGQQSLQRSAKQAEEAINQARARATEIVSQAEKRASQMIEEAKASARAEGERLVAGAKAEIEQEVARAKESLRAQVAALAVAGAEQILRREVDAKAHADLIAAVQKQI